MSEYCNPEPNNTTFLPFFCYWKNLPIRNRNPKSSSFSLFNTTSYCKQMENIHITTMLSNYTILAGRELDLFFFFVYQPSVHFALITKRCFEI